jgi:hypothetical protein
MSNVVYTLGPNLKIDQHQNQEVTVTVVYREEEKNRSKGVGKSSASPRMQERETAVKWLAERQEAGKRGFE